MYVIFNNYSWIIVLVYTTRQHSKYKQDNTFCPDLFAFISGLFVFMAWQDDRHAMKTTFPGWDLNLGILPNIPRLQSNQIARHVACGRDVYDLGQRYWQVDRGPRSLPVRTRPYSGLWYKTWRSASISFFFKYVLLSTHHTKCSQCKDAWK